MRWVLEEVALPCGPQLVGIDEAKPLPLPCDQLASFDNSAAPSGW
jgi:hypothetical protein